MPVGGSIESVTLNGRSFSVASDADSQRELGGWKNEVQMNGDGTARLIKTRVPWSLSDIVLSIDDANGDAEALQALTNRNAFYPISVTYASGAIYQGSGQVVDDNPTASQATTAAASLKGEGELTKQ